MRGTISKAFARAEPVDDVEIHEDEMDEVANSEDGEDPRAEAAGVETDGCALDNSF